MLAPPPAARQTPRRRHVGRRRSAPPAAYPWVRAHNVAGPQGRFDARGDVCRIAVLPHL